MKTHLLILALLIATLSLHAQSSYTETSCTPEKKVSLANEVGFVLSCIAGITFVSLTMLSKKKK